MFTASAPKGKPGGARLVALDAATGKPSEGFGANGMADIGVPWNGVPLVFKNVVALGATVGEVPDGPPGDTRAFDARTGKKLWEFHTVPRPGENGHETWLNDGWKSRSGVNIWGWYMTVDEQRGILYMPIAGPAANYWGGDRPGSNLFANSIVAVDAETGKYKWHFQTVHHDLWDSDMPSPPTLVDIRQNGRTIPALALRRQDRLDVHPRSRDRQADLRRRGAARAEGRRARRVVFADAAVSGEAAAAHARRVQQGSDMVTADDTSADHVQACQELWDKSGGFYNAGPFTPFGYHEEGAPPKIDDSVPGRHRRRELGRAGRRSDERATCSSTRTTRRSSGGSRRSPAGPELRPRHRRLEAAVRSRQRERRRARTSRSARR